MPALYTSGFGYGNGTEANVALQPLSTHTIDSEPEMPVPHVSKRPHNRSECLVSIQTGAPRATPPGRGHSAYLLLILEQVVLSMVVDWLNATVNSARQPSNTEIAGKP